jgi:hypothetical protein
MENASASQYDGKVKPLFPSTARFAGYPILVLGTLATLSSFAQLFVNEVTLLQILVGPAFVAMGYVMVTSYEGIRIDTAFMRYRKYEWIAGFRRGEWLTLPTVTRITVAPFNSTYVQQNGIAPSFVVREGGLYRVLLSIEGSRIGIIAAIDKQTKALEKADLLNQVFSTGVTLAP